MNVGNVWFVHAIGMIDLLWHAQTIRFQLRGGGGGA